MLTCIYDNSGRLATVTDSGQGDGSVVPAGYAYGDEEWGDLLTAFDGIGDPTTYVERVLETLLTQQGEWSSICQIVLLD